MAADELKQKLDGLIKKTGAFDCVECGKCTSLCPITKENPDFAPRLIVVKALEGLSEQITSSRDIWICLTCGRCSAKCPYKVNYTEFIRGMRETARKGGNAGSQFWGCCGYPKCKGVRPLDESDGSVRSDRSDG